MSVKVMTAVFERYPNGGGEMLLALALADHSSDDGSRIYPSINHLAQKTRQAERSVQYQLRRMEDVGWLILVNAGNGGRNQHREYQISPDWIKGAEIAPFKKGAIHDTKGATDDAKGCNPQQERVQPIAPAYNHQRTIREPSEKKSAVAPSIFVLPDWINKSHWDAWHSCPKRKKATDAQKQMAVDKLDTWRQAGIDFAGALENAAIGGWQGLFKPDDKKPSGNRYPDKNAIPAVSDIWHESAAGVAQKAAEMGLPNRGDMESHPAFKSRVVAAAGRRPALNLGQLAAMAEKRMAA